MTSRSIAGPGFAPWSVRFLDSAPGPIARAPLLALALYAAFWLLHLATGALGVESRYDPHVYWRGELLLDVLIAYVPLASLLGNRGALRDLHDLRPLLPLPDAGFEALRADLTRFDRTSLLLAGLVFGLAGGLQILLDPSVWPSDEPPSLHDPGAVWTVARNGLLGWAGGRAIVHFFQVTRRVARLGERLEVDLLRPESLAPFARFGLRTVLLWILATSWFALLIVVGQAASSVPAGVVVITLLSLLALVLPVLGVHGNLRRCKQRELERVRRAIGLRREESLEMAAAPERPGGHLADLVSYEQRIASVREWPFDASTILRFTLYVALGLGSWIGGAVVERLLGSVLD